jgi:hypothetical protein
MLKSKDLFTFYSKDLFTLFLYIYFAPINIKHLIVCKQIK